MMNDEKFELTISDLAGSGTYYADIADELRARDTAQREAIERLQGELDEYISSVPGIENERDNLRERLAGTEQIRDSAIANHFNEMRVTRDLQTQLAEAVGLLSGIQYSKSYAELESFMPQLDAFLARHAQAEQHEAREPVLARPEHGVALDEALELTMDRYSGALDKLATIEQQEAQGSQAVDDERQAALEEMFQVTYAGDIWEILGRLYDAGYRRAAFATQPAAGEPEQQTAINADDLPTKKYPLGAFDFDAPVAAGDPIQVEAVAVTREDEDGLYLDWVLEGGISALEAPGVVLLVAHGTVTDDQGSGEVYLAPPAAAHGDEAVRKDTTEEIMQRACAELPEDWYIEVHLENGSGYATLFNDGIVVDFGQDFGSIGAHVEAAIDAAMRAQAGEGGE